MFLKMSQLMTMELIMYQVSFVVDCRVYRSDLDLQYHIHYAHSTQVTIHSLCESTKEYLERAQHL